jgi:hypothetical protein
VPVTLIFLGQTWLASSFAALATDENHAGRGAAWASTHLIDPQYQTRFRPDNALKKGQKRETSGCQMQPDCGSTQPLLDGVWAANCNP